MATFSEHGDAIKAAIKAAQDDGFLIEVDLSYGCPGWTYDEIVTKVDVDLWNGIEFVTLFTEER